MNIFRTAGLAAAAFVAIATMSSANAVTVTWDTTVGNNNDYLNNTQGNTRSFLDTTNTLTLQARAFTVTSDATTGAANMGVGLSNAYLAVYNGSCCGLGVSSGNESLGSSPEHTVDNNPGNNNLSEMVVFQLPTANYDPLSVKVNTFSNSSTTGGSNITYLVGSAFTDVVNGSVNSLGDFTGKTLNYLISKGFQRCDDNPPSTASRTINLNGSQASCTPTGNLSGKFLIIAPLLGGNTDDFKIATIAGVPPTNVPEPSTLALLGLGAIGLHFARRRRA